MCLPKQDCTFVVITTIHNRFSCSKVSIIRIYVLAEFFKNEENKTIEIGLSHSELKLSSNVRTKGTNSEEKKTDPLRTFEISLEPLYSID